MLRKLREFEPKPEGQVITDPGILAEANIAAQIIGGDFGVKVDVGKPGEGSFFNSKTGEIKIDPLQFIKKDNPKFQNFISELKTRQVANPLEERQLIAEIFSKYFPEIKKEDIEMDELIFLIGHEAGHRAITRGPNEIGLRPEKIEEFQNKIGFFYGSNVVEDPADNNWVRNKFPKIGQSMKKIYDEQTKIENVPAGIKHPDVQRAISLLGGHIPRFTWFGAEVIRYWWKGQFSKNLKPEIREAMEKIKKYLPLIFNNIPSKEKAEKETIEKARQRFLEYYRDVWPELEKLVKMDIDDEKINQMIEKMEDEIAQQLEDELKKELERHKKRNEQFQKQQQLERQRQELEKQGQKLEKEIEDLKKKMEGASPQQREQLEKQIQEKQSQREDNQRKQKEIGKQEKEMRQQQQSEESRQIQEQYNEYQKEGQKIQKEIDELNKKIQNASSQKRKELEKQLQRKMTEKQKIDGSLKDLKQKLEQFQKQQQLERQRQKLEKQGQKLEKEIEDLKKKMEGASPQQREQLEKQIQEKQSQREDNQRKQKEIGKQEKKEQRYSVSPLEDLSPRLKKKLKEIYDKLSDDEKKELEKIAKEKLEDLEDELNKQLQGKLNKDRPKSHKEIRIEKKEKKEKETRTKEKEIEKVYKKIREQVKENLEKEMTEYGKAYAEVKPLIEKLYQKLKKVFEPLEDEWEEGYSSGQRLSLRMARKAKIKPELKTKIWERKRAPEELKYRFVVLVDTSGSMIGQKMEETFKGLVVLTEVLSKLNIPLEIIAFSVGIGKFKDFKEKLNKDLRKKLSGIKSFGGNSTHTGKATLYVQNEIKKNKKEDENIFLITMTDGQANGPLSGELPEIIANLSKEGVKQIGIGLGPDTEFVKEIYPASLYLPEIGLNDHKDNGFDSLMAKLLKQIIQHPEKFRLEDKKNN